MSDFSTTFADCILMSMEYTLLNKIDSPRDIKGLSMDELRTLCEEIRRYMIECCAVNPGHLGPSLGAVELIVALHYVYDAPKDKLVFDVGHQAYAHKIITGRREAFRKNRMKDGISGFPKRSESEYDAFGVGHSSTSISAALGFAEAARQQGLSQKVVALIGDEATVKRIYMEKDHIRLQPENPEYEPIIVKEAVVLGKVISLVRYF